MRHLSQHARMALTLGAAAALAACAKKDDVATTGDSAAAAAATTPADSAAAAATPTASAKTDADFVAALAVTNGGEIATGKLASTKATDAEVKAFAKMLVDDHMAMSKEGDQLAAKLNLPVTKPGDEAKDAAETGKDVSEDLKGKTGKDFDKAFMEAQIDAHQKALDLLNEIVNSTSANAELKTLAQGAVPKVQAHLDRAKTLKEKLDK